MDKRAKTGTDQEPSVALITGGASGIGAAAAQRLASEGVLLALLDRDERGMNLVAGKIAQAAGHKPLVIAANVERADEVGQSVAQVFHQFNGIGILVNCAGISSHIPFLEMTEDAWNKVMNINLKGTFLCCRAVAPIMVKQRKGSIINISSGTGATGSINLAHYSASKAGILGLTKSIALELAPYGVRVNAVAPGATDTPLFRHYHSHEIAKVLSRIPLGRLAEPEDVAAAISFLAGLESKHITGQTLYLNGGKFMP